MSERPYPVLPLAIERALCWLAPRCPADSRWAVSCGTALALHGLPHRPQDLDIFAGSADAARIADVLRSVPVVFPFARRVSGGLSSDWARYCIDGLEVDVVGDFSLRGNGRSMTLDADHPCWSRLDRFPVGGIKVPVLSLQDLLAFYEAFPGEPLKVKLLRTALEDGVPHGA